MKKTLLIILLSSILSTFFAFMVFKYLYTPKTIVIHEPLPGYLTNSTSNPSKEESFESDLENYSPNEFINAAGNARKAVVFIKSTLSNSPRGFYHRNYANPTGSGVIISGDGYIITNFHVIKNAQNIEITLNDKREFKAKLVGTDSATDLALLKINSEKLPYLKAGNSDALQIGEWVLAIGNPFRLQSTVTAGIVSAKARNINIMERSDIESFIQTDAAVNPGNSGGALINSKGELVGINTAIISNSGGYEGFSFAIPSNLVSKVSFDLKHFGAVQRGWLGISISNVNDQHAKELELEAVSGVMIETVNKEGAAKAAGLKKKDVITSVNGIKVSSSPEFMEQVAQFRPGDKINLEIFRKGNSFVSKVVLRNHLNSTSYVAINRDPIITDLGFELRDLDRTEKKRFKKDGILVVSVRKGSIIADVKLKPGFIITSINDQQISSVEQFIKQLTLQEGIIEVNGFYEKTLDKIHYRFYKN